VKNNNVELASSILWRIREEEGVWKKIKQNAFFVPPAKKRRLKREENIKRCRRREQRKDAKRD
jgi:ribosomal protein S21